MMSKLDPTRPPPMATLRLTKAFNWLDFVVVFICCVASGITSVLFITIMIEEIAGLIK